MRVGAWGSPFGKPREVNLQRHCGRYVLPKGAWLVHTGPNRVSMAIVDARHDPFENMTQAPGTGIRPGHCHRPDPMPYPLQPPQWPPLRRPRPQIMPPRCARFLTLVHENAVGTVFADGQNVALTGSGCALVIQVFSV